MKTMIILATLALAACATPSVPPPPKVVEVKILYPVPCVDELPARPPVHDDFDLLAMTDYDFVQAIHKDRLHLDDYSRKQEVLLQACKAAAK